MFHTLKNVSLETDNLLVAFMRFMERRMGCDKKRVGKT